MIGGRCFDLDSFEEGLQWVNTRGEQGRKDRFGSVKYGTVIARYQFVTGIFMIAAMLMGPRKAKLSEICGNAYCPDHRSCARDWGQRSLARFTYGLARSVI